MPSEAVIKAKPSGAAAATTKPAAEDAKVSRKVIDDTNETNDTNENYE